MRHLRTLSVPVAVAALTAALSVPAMAQVEEEIVSGPKTRDQVVAELQEAHMDGTLAQLRGEQTYAPDFQEALGEPVMYSNTQSEADTSVSIAADTTSQLQYAPPAAGGKSRAQVLDELRQAHEDGSLARMWSEQGYAPELEAVR